MGASLKVFSVDFDYVGARGERHPSNVHVLAEVASDIFPALQARHPGSFIRKVVPIDLPLPVLLDDYYRGQQ